MRDGGSREPRPFSSGCYTADLKDAKSILDELDA
jgi:hypothetical protein